MASNTRISSNYTVYVLKKNKKMKKMSNVFFLYNYN